MNKTNFKSLLAVLLTVLMVFSIVPMSVSAAETTVTIDFSSLTGKNAEITSSNALSTFQGCASDGSYLTAVTTTKIYNGNGNGGLKPNASGFIKTGTSSVNGQLTMTFTEKVNKVELVCHAWNTNGSDTVSVNDSATQKAPTNGDITEKLTFEIEASETVSIVTAKRTFIKSITVYFGSTGNEGGNEGGDTSDTPVVPATLAEQIAAANALANKEYLPYESTITGTITNDPKASSYNEGQFDFIVSDGTNSVRCYFVPVTGGTPAMGDTVTVTGKLTAYNGAAQFDSTAAATWVSGGEGGDDATVIFPIKDDDSFAIYYPAGGTVIGSTASGKKLAAVEATLAADKVTRVDGMAEFTADFIDATTFYLLVDGKYLTSGATGNSLSLADAASDYAVWTLEEAKDGWYIKNVNAAYNGNAQYVEFYSGFTTYGLNTGKADIYTFNFYKITEPAPFEDGDSFVIYYPAGGTVIGSTASGKKLAAVEATVVDGKIVRADGMAEFTVEFVEGDIFCLVVDGKYLTSGATGNSLSLADELSDYAGWILEEAEDGWYIKNVNAAYNGNAQYIEFYSGFTTYGLNTSKADIYTFTFYELVDGSDEGDDEGDEEVKPEDPAADSTLTVEEVLALGASKDHDTYTEGKYYVVGEIVEVYNTQYGNMRIKDANGNILTIYGTYSADGSTRYDAMEVQPAAGDTVKIYGIVGQYNGTVQVKNGWIVAHTPAASEPDKGLGDAMTVTVLLAVIALAGASMVIASRKRRFN